jgi:hypothetical protein
MRLVNLTDQTRFIKVIMIADDGPEAEGRRREKTYELPPFGQVLRNSAGRIIAQNPMTVGVHSDFWPGESANFTTRVECDDVCDAGMIGRPTDELWNPNALALFQTRAYCM